jgi:hypothetical protein
MYPAVIDIHIHYMAGISLRIHTFVGRMNQFSKNVFFLSKSDIVVHTLNMLMTIN